ncbi:hypothetical protein [uncultured Massilia sp.]|uniref:hypothetical protein n=1 Tax=uncultured Massilia sp. TaxID=169973 RepID=UPI00258B41DC|nr:hypothetical protein [uncultured Massilia sp.]
MQKLWHQVGGEWVEHTHPAVCARDTTGGAERLVATAPGGDPNVLLSLVEAVGGPYALLYVLHTPRGEGEAGRYQSPELELADVRAFLERHAGFLRADARFDLWAHSFSENATVVWDRHNLIHAYGPLERFEAVLHAQGFGHGLPSMAFAHQHHYRADCDGEAAAVLRDFDWQYSPLRPEDEQ